MRNEGIAVEHLLRTHPLPQVVLTVSKQVFLFCEPTYFMNPHAAALQRCCGRGGGTELAPVSC